jgi:hypothetical protein
MTPGQEALQEAARLEAARVYGGVVVEHRQPRAVMAARAEAEIEAAWHGSDPLIDAVRAGWTTSRIMQRYGATYREIRDIRRNLGAA